MDTLLTLVLEVYRLAQEVPATEFPDLALQMLNTAVRFRSATWSDAKVSGANTVDIYSVHLHNEPDDMRSTFSSLNRKHKRRVLDAARQPGKSSSLSDAIAYFNDRDEAPMREYLRRYGHERSLLITDLRQWLALYRPGSDDPFDAREQKIVDLLMPHFAEALMINRVFAVGNRIGGDSRASDVARALIDRNGVFLHCGGRFLELLRREWADWDEPRIPAALLADVVAGVVAGESVRIADGRCEISVRAFGDALLLIGKEVSPLERLSPRELVIAREYGAGKSHKTIARDLRLAPATVRNVLQKAYRKLEIDNKAALGQLLAREQPGHKRER